MGNSTQGIRSGTAAKVQFFLFHNNSGAYVQIRDQMIVGRTEGDARYPEDSAVSRRQCRLNVVGDEIYIEDLSSTNRTRVNSVPIVSGKKRRIRLNDVIECGAQRFILTYQNRWKPSNVEDFTRRSRPFRAIRKADGSLTATITGFIQERTATLIDRGTYRRMKIRRRLQPVVAPVKRGIGPFLRFLLLIGILGSLYSQIPFVD